MVVRDFAERNGLKYLLSATEWAFPGSYNILEQVLADLKSIDGIICYSMFILPEDQTYRNNIIDDVLAEGRDIHFALENLSITSNQERCRVEDIWLTSSALCRNGNLVHEYLSSFLDEAVE